MPQVRVLPGAPRRGGATGRRGTSKPSTLRVRVSPPALQALVAQRPERLSLKQRGVSSNPTESTNQAHYARLERTRPRPDTLLSRQAQPLSLATHIPGCCKRQTG